MNETVRLESNGRFEAHGRRAQEMTRFVIAWMLVHSNLSNKSENAGGNIGGGSKKSGGHNYLFLIVRRTCTLLTYAPNGGGLF